MIRKLSFRIEENFSHFYLDNSYLGMFVYEKGELSDFRAIIRKNRQTINSADKGHLEKALKDYLHELLNHYLIEGENINENELQEVKSEIILQNADQIGEAVNELTTKMEGAQ